MAEKTIKTRIINKHGSVASWATSSLVLKEGEIALAYVETTKPNGQGGYYTVPTYLMKVGDGKNTFSGLEWVAAPASDVYEWAKKANLALSDIPMTEVTETLKGTFYTETEIDAKISALNTEIGKKHDQHEHPYLPDSTKYAGSATQGGPANSVANSMLVQLNGGNTEGTDKFTFDGSAVKSVNITPSAIGTYTKAEIDAELAKKQGAHEHPYAPEVHTHDDRYYTKDEIVEKLSSVLEYKGTKTNTNELPTSGNEKGDVWNISTSCAASGSLPKVNAGDNVAWNGESWDVLAGIVDLSGYYTKAQVDSELAKYEPVHDHPYLPTTTKYAGSDSVGGPANSVKNNLVVKLNGGSTEGTDLFTFNGSTGKTIDVTPANIGASALGHDHNDKYYTETEVDALLAKKADNHEHPYAPENHTHATSITTSTGTNQLTLEHGSKYEIGIDNGQKFVFTMPSDSNSHYTTGIWAGTSQTTSNKATNDPYVTVTDDGTYRNQIQFKGTDSTKVSSAGGVITVEALPATNNSGETMTYIFDCGGPND